MTEHHNKSREKSGGWRFWRSPYWMAVSVFLGTAGLLLIYEHRTHLIVGNEGLLAVLAICAAVLVHLFRFGRNN